MRHPWIKKMTKKSTPTRVLAEKIAADLLTRKWGGSLVDAMHRDRIGDYRGLLVHRELSDRIEQHLSKPRVGRKAKGK